MKIPVWQILLDFVCAPLYWYRKHLVFDQPHHFYLLDKLAGDCADQADKLGLDSLSDPQKALLHVWSAKGIIGNGGFRYFFECGMDGPATAWAYDLVGRPKRAAAVRKALEFFPGGKPSSAFSERLEQIAAIERTNGEKFEALNSLIWGDEHSELATLVAFVTKNRSAFTGRYLPSTKPGGWFSEIDPPPADSAAYDIALWLLRVHAWVHVRRPGREGSKFISQESELPADVEGIEEVRLSSNRSTTDRDLARMVLLHALDDVIRIDLHDTNVSAMGLRCLGHWSKLKSLDLGGTGVSAHDLEAIPPLPALEDIWLPRGIEESCISRLRRHGNIKRIEGLSLSDATLSDLKFFTKIDNLSVSKANLTEAGYAHLGEMIGLKSLSLRHLALPSDAFRSMQGLVNLENLDLCSSLIGDHALQFIGGFLKLTSLNLECCDVTDDGLLCLSELSRLERLQLYKTGVADRGLKALRNMTELKQLTLSKTQVNGSGLLHLADLRKLTEFYLSNVPLDDAGAKHLQNLHGLELLYLDGTNVTDEALSSLQPLSRLSVLSLDNTKVRGPGLASLVELPALEKLYLAGTPVGNSALKALSQIPTLRYLDLSGTRIDNDALPALKELGQLTGLSVRRSLMETKIFEELKAALPNCHVSDW